MQLPATFPDGTAFAEVGLVPITISRNGDCQAWDDPNAEAPRWFSPETVLRRGKQIPEAEFRALFDANVVRASPARLLTAAQELLRRREAYLAGLKAQGLSEEQIARVLEQNRAANMELDAEQRAIRAIGAAKRRSLT